jgi:predicted transcriptional regulator
MSTPVTTVASTDTLERAEDLMMMSRVRHLPVVEGDVLVGLVSLSDLLAVSISWLRDPTSDEDRAAKRKFRVEEVMRRSLETVYADDDAIVAADVFLRQKISCLPVIDESRHLLGILTDADFVRLARATLAEQANATMARKQSARTIPTKLAKKPLKKAPPKRRAAHSKVERKPSRSTLKPRRKPARATRG